MSNNDNFMTPETWRDHCQSGIELSSPMTAKHELSLIALLITATDEDLFADAQEAIVDSPLVSKWVREAAEGVKFGWITRYRRQFSTLTEPFIGDITSYAEFSKTMEASA